MTQFHMKALVGMLTPEAQGARLSRWLIAFDNKVELLEGIGPTVQRTKELIKVGYQPENISTETARPFLAAWLGY